MFVSCKNFMQWIQNYTEALQTTVVLLRTVGPDGVDDATKANQIYSAYYLNMQSENPAIFDKLLYNEFTFVEFSDEESAQDFCRDNFPNVKPDDTDYFIQYVIFTNGLYAGGNDGMNGLREPEPQTL
jgi:hypothetical protein